jgi:hypothetical protein
MDEIIGDWRMIMDSSPNIIRMIKSRRIRCSTHGVDVGGEEK